MQIQVFDTYVKNKDGDNMHFDVFILEGKTVDDALKAATGYLTNVEHGPITTNECSFCHIQTAKPEQEKDLGEKGYFIYKMSENCP